MKKHQLETASQIPKTNLAMKEMAQDWLMMEEAQANTKSLYSVAQL